MLLGADLYRPYWKAVLSLLERFSVQQLALPLDPKYQEQFDALSLGSINVDDIAMLRVMGYDGAPVAELKTLIARAAERRIRFWCIGDETTDRVRLLGERLVSLPPPVALLIPPALATKHAGEGEVPLGAILPSESTVAVLVMPSDCLPPQPSGTLAHAPSVAFVYRFFL